MRPTLTAVLRCVFAAASFAGFVDQFVRVVASPDVSLVTLFSYFTILGNLFAVVVFVTGAVRILRGTPSTVGWEWVRAGNVVYMAFVGIVFNTLLVGADLGDLPPWVNVIHHMVMPAAVVADWLVNPPQRKLSVGRALWLVVVPVVYTVYTLVRGPIAHWYPYPFFNPDRVGGYGGVAVYCAVLLVAFVVLALVVRSVGNALWGRVRGMPAFQS
jgi:hypothetical protein